MIFSDSTFAIHSGRKVVLEHGSLADRQLTFAIERLGDHSSAASVDWHLVRVA